MERGRIELHFFVLRELRPKDSYSSCYVIVRDIDPLYADFRAQLKRTLGRVPTRGIPRIGFLKDMSYGVRQFLMTDPGGNTIRIGQPLQTDAAARAPDAAPARGRLGKALDAAVLLAESKGDPPTAARVLDGALEASPDAPVILRVKAWILRADVALAMDDDALAASLLAEVARTQLTDEDRATLADELARAEDLRRTLA